MWGQLETRNAAGSTYRRESPSPAATDVLVAARRDGESVPTADESSRSKPLHDGLFDHVVGAGEQGRRNCDAKSLGGLEIDHQLELG